MKKIEISASTALIFAQILVLKPLNFGCFQFTRPSSFRGKNQFASPTLPKSGPHIPTLKKNTVGPPPPRVAMVSFKITWEKRQPALLRYYSGYELTDILKSLDDTVLKIRLSPRLRLWQGILPLQETIKKINTKTLVMLKVKGAMSMLFTVEK